jgi:hypothetical protein
MVQPNQEHSRGCLDSLYIISILMKHESGLAWSNQTFISVVAKQTSELKSYLLMKIRFVSRILSLFKVLKHKPE